MEMLSTLTRTQAMAWLERGCDEHFNPGVLLRPGFDSLRADRDSEAWFIALV